MNIITNIDMKASLKQTAVRLCFLGIRTCGMVRPLSVFLGFGCILPTCLDPFIRPMCAK